MRANDLAFLAMDFDFEGKDELGNLFLRNAARAFRDPAMLKLAHFYKCYREPTEGPKCDCGGNLRRAPRGSKTLSAAYEPASELALNLIKISTDGDLSDTIRPVLLHLAGKQSATVDVPHNFSGT